jgi:hypothetical protein
MNVNYVKSKKPMWFPDHEIGFAPRIGRIQGVGVVARIVLATVRAIAVPDCVSINWRLRFKTTLARLWRYRPDLQERAA